MAISDGRPLSRVADEILVRWPSAAAGPIGVVDLGSIPFEVRRMYWLWSDGGSPTRGGHALKSCEQMLLVLRGSVRAKVHDGKAGTEVNLDSSHPHLHLPPMTWRELSHFSDECVVAVLASTDFDPSDYVRDFGVFIRSVTS